MWINVTILAVVAIFILIIINMIEQHEEHHFLLFINSKSGGCKGRQYLSLGENRLKLRSKQGFYVYVYLYDLFNPTQRDTGLKKTLELTKTSKNVNIIICGGDGTILWVVSSVINAGINPEDVCFGVIPIGTGNDFSRSLGWGGSPITFSEDNIRQLRKTIQKWVKASKQKFDLWDVSISTFEGGKITLSSSNVSQQGEESKTNLSKTFSNYVGIGIDARVSYHFEKNRTQSKFINLALYGCLGFCFCLKKTQKMHDKIVQFSESESSDYSSSEGQGQQSAKSVISQDRKNIKLLQKSLSTEYSQVKIKKGYTGIVCLNCTSYMSGVMNIFKTKKIAAKNKTAADFTQQTFNDGKLEFVGFKNQLALGLQRFIHTAGKIAQGEGPYTIKFDPSKSTKQTFVQIDGEAVLVQGLKQVRITKSKLGQIRVLTNIES